MTLQTCKHCFPFCHFPFDQGSVDGDWRSIHTHNWGSHLRNQGSKGEGRHLARFSFSPLSASQPALMTQSVRLCWAGGKLRLLTPFLLGEVSSISGLGKVEQPLVPPSTLPVGECRMDAEVLPCAQYRSIGILPNSPLGDIVITP